MIRSIWPLGRDKSSYDQPVTWAGGPFAWSSLRLSSTKYGKPYVDPAALVDKGLQDAAGVWPVPYSWINPREAIAPQAFKFLEALAAAGTFHLPPMLDLENYYAATGFVGMGSRVILPWLEIVEGATKQQAVIYTSPSYIRSYLVKDTWLRSRPLMLAHWDVSWPKVCPPWTMSDLIAWQSGPSMWSTGYDGAAFGSKGNVCLQYWTGESLAPAYWPAWVYTG